MSGIRTAVQTLVFNKVVRKADNYIIATGDFLYNYWDKDNQEAVDDIFPITLTVRNENANAFLVLAKATMCDLVTVRGEITISATKEDDGTYTNGIDIKVAHAQLIDNDSPLENYIFLAGKSGQKKDTPIRTVEMGKGTIHSTKMAVEKMPPQGGWKKNAAGYDDRESVWFDIQARTDENGKGVGNVLKYTIGSPFTVEGKLSIGRSGDAIFISVWVNSLVLQGSRKPTEESRSEYSDKPFGSSELPTGTDSPVVAAKSKGKTKLPAEANF